MQHGHVSITALSGADASALDASGSSPRDLVPEGPDDEDIKEALDKASGKKGARGPTGTVAKKKAAPKPVAEEPFEKRFAKMSREEQLRKVRPDPSCGKYRVRLLYCRSSSCCGLVFHPAAPALSRSRRSRPTPGWRTLPVPRCPT